MGDDDRYPLRIYYDASCPLCRAEMHGLKARDAAGALELVDCSTPGFHDAELSAAGISVPAAMARIHARDATGRWHDGIAVFELAYRAAGLQRIARILGHPRVSRCLERLYPWIARNRRALSRLGLATLLAMALRSTGRPPAHCPPPAQR